MSTFQEESYSKTNPNKKEQLVAPRGTRFAHMQISQLKDMARDNTLKRLILRQLVLESNFAATNSKFAQLVAHFGSKTVPLFHKTEGRLFTRVIRVSNGYLTVRLNIIDKQYAALNKRLAPLYSLVAQGLFSVDMNHSIGVDQHLAGLTTQITQLLERFNVARSTTVQLTSFLCKCIAAMASDFKPAVVIALCVDLLMTSGIPFDSCVTACTGLAVHFRTFAAFMKNELIAQTTSADPFVALGTILCVLFGTVTLGKLPKECDINDCVAGITKLGNASRGFGAAWTGIEKVITLAINAVYEWRFGLPTEIGELEQFMTGVQMWFKEVQELIAFRTTDEIEKDAVLCARVETLFRQGAQFATKAATLNVSRDMLHPFNVHWNILKNFYEKAKSSGAFSGGPRTEPLVIYLWGDSGVGKSGLMYMLSTDLLKLEGIPEDVNGKPDITQEIYCRNVEQEFWDGYNNQRVTLYDDFGQIVDSASNPNAEIMEIIRTGNLTKYPLHMAGLEEKAKTCFNSRVIICTSNVDIADFQAASIACPEALRRRVDVCVKVAIKPEFATERKTTYSSRKFLDPAKIKALTGSPHSTNVYNLTLTNPLTGQRASNTMDYGKLRDHCLESYKRKFVRCSELHEFLRTLAEQPLEAQVGTQEEIAKKNIDFHFVSMEELLGWNESKLQSFVEGYDLYKDYLTGKARACISQMRATKTYSKELMLEYLKDSPLWNKLSQGLFQARVQDDYAMFHAVKDTITGVTERVIADTQSLVKHLRDLALSFQEKASAFCALVKKTVQENPMMAIAAVLVPLILLGLYKMFIQAPKRLGVLDAHHVGLNSRRTLHSHICLNCEEEYEHTHGFSSVLDSVHRGQLCHPCRDLGYTSVFQPQEPTGYVLMKGSSHYFVPFDLELKGELAISGDPRTIRKTTKKVELSASGDPKTVKKETTRVELSASGDPRTVAKKTIKTEGINVELQDVSDPEETLDFEAQLRLDANAHNVSQKMLSNMYTLEFGDGNKFNYAVKMLFLRGRTAVTVAHARPCIESCSHVRLTNQFVQGGHVIATSKLRLQQVEGADGAFKDQMLIAFPREIHDHSDITGSITGSADLSFSQISSVLMVADTRVVAMKYGLAKAVDKPVHYIDTARNAKYMIRTCYEYSLETTNGDCGGILIGIATSCAKKILGLHVAGRHGLGVASPFNIKDLEKALANMPMDAQVSLNLDNILANNEIERVRLPEGDFVPVGQSLYNTRNPSKTAIRPSLIHGEVTTPITAPSVLEPVLVEGLRVDPMMKGLKKAGVIPKGVDDEKLSYCLNDVKNIVCADALPEHSRVLTNMEAVTGIENDTFATAITRSTSAGFPKSREAGKYPGKTKWLGDDEYRLDQEIEQEMEFIIENARNNIRTPTIWVDTLKDERRPLEKVEVAKTRVFSAGPMCFTLVFRKYFLGFAAHCSRKRIENEIAVGTNVYSHDWTRIANKMSSKGDKVIAGDFSNFDGTLVLAILAPVVDIINEFYDDGEENAQIRRVLWKEIVNSIHVCGRDVYMWTHSQPSGCPITAVLNSLYNSISMRYVWLLVAPVELRSMKSFRRHVAMISYGDDNVLNISDEAIEFFNQLTIAEGYAQIGMTYTDELKSGEMIKFRHLSDVSFLKRKFEWSNAEFSYMAPLTLDTVLEMVSWIRGPLDDEDKTRENVETSCFELSLHGKEIFDKWSSKMIKACAQMSARPQVLTYQEYRNCELVKYGGMVALS